MTCTCSIRNLPHVRDADRTKEREIVKCPLCKAAPEMAELLMAIPGAERPQDAVIDWYHKRAEIIEELTKSLATPVED